VLATEPGMIGGRRRLEIARRKRMELNNVGEKEDGSDVAGKRGCGDERHGRADSCERDTSALKLKAPHAASMQMIENGHKQAHNYKACHSLHDELIVQSYMGA